MHRHVIKRRITIILSLFWLPCQGLSQPITAGYFQPHIWWLWLEPSYLTSMTCGITNWCACQTDRHVTIRALPRYNVFWNISRSSLSQSGTGCRRNSLTETLLILTVQIYHRNYTPALQYRPVVLQDHLLVNRVGRNILPLELILDYRPHGHIRHGEWDLLGRIIEHTVWYMARFQLAVDDLVSLHVICAPLYPVKEAYMVRRFGNMPVQQLDIGIFQPRLL